jgi:hypothetical protein
LQRQALKTREVGMDNREKAELTYKMLKKRREKRNRRREQEYKDFKIATVEKCMKYRHDRRG